MQADLRVKVDNLTRQLEIRVEETEATRRLVEMKIEAKYRKMPEQDRRIICNLEEQLSSAREQLKVLSEENILLTHQNTDLQRVSAPSKIRKVWWDDQRLLFSNALHLFCIHRHRYRRPILYSNLQR